MLSLPAQQHADDRSAFLRCVAAIDMPHPVCLLPHLSILAWRSCSGSGRAPASTAAAAAACTAASHSRCFDVIPVGCRASEHPVPPLQDVCSVYASPCHLPCHPSGFLHNAQLQAGLLSRVAARAGGSAHGGRLFVRSPSSQQLALLVRGVGFPPALSAQGQELCLLPQFV